MTTSLVAFLVAFAVSVVATLVVRSAAWSLGIVDRPDGFRKVHSTAIPRLGGVAIFLAFLAPVAALYFVYRNDVSDLLYQRPFHLAGLVGGGAIALGMGIADDIRSLPARWKLLLQIAAACVAFAAGIAIKSVSNPFGEPIMLGLLSFPFTVFWFVACMNAINLLDGLDGLAAGISLFVTATMFLVALMFRNTFSMLLLSSLGGATLGFLLFNFHPARVFLGDSGSMFLGFMVGGLALLGSQKAETAVALFIPIVALGLPVLDTSLAIARRWSRRLPISAADKQHIHHVLLSWGLTQRQVVVTLYVASIILGGAALVMAAGHHEMIPLLLGALGVIAFVSIRVLGGLRLSDLWGRFTEDLRRRQQSGEARTSVQEAVARMRVAMSAEAVWEAFSTGLEGIDFDFATLRLLDVPKSGLRTFTWSNHENQVVNRQMLGPDSWSARFRVRSNGHLFGELEVSKTVQDSPLLAGASELVDRLRSEMASQIERLFLNSVGPRHSASTSDSS